MNDKITSINFGGTELHLLPEKAVYIPKMNYLLLSDLHLGKIQHFIANGLTLPSVNEFSNLSALQDLLIQHNPKEIFFLGDLFHSDWNASYSELNTFIHSFPQTQFHLVKGNHDILSDHLYQALGLNVYQESYRLEKLLFKHQVDTIGSSVIPTISGHVHPAVILKGTGKQYLRLPCFWQRSYDLVLPAFGYYTGTHPVSCEEQDIIHVIADSTIVQVQ